ncbi:MAG: 2,3,4,5-tetrahydropyridine-2,6-dicarboxylate N-acetyltransferase [Atopobiaceae bacterium]|jgi:tetrahydrodipicolinate N-acetyltransferase
MDAQEIIDYIATAPKKTPVKAYINEKIAGSIDYPASAHVFGDGLSKIVFCNWDELSPVLTADADKIADVVVESDRRNSGVALLDIKDIHARIEPGALIREKVEIEDNAVIMMGAVINIGAHIGASSMIDMGAVLGGRAIVGKRCHIGAGAVLAGVVEPASATPVVIEDDVLIGANAVVIEGCRVGAGAVVAAGAVVVEDVPPRAVVAGCPAKIIKYKDEKTAGKTGLVDALRNLS